MYKKFESLLNERSVTAYEVSKNTGVLQSTLSDWKNGKYTPKLDKLQRIADYFGVPITYFLENEKEELNEPIIRTTSNTNAY